jgi:hypothetical protein
VQVDEWNADGTAHVKYRGALVDRHPAPGQRAEPGAYRIVAELVGNRLMVKKPEPPR